MIAVKMMGERYASIGQLMELKAAGNYDAMRYLLKNYKYSRYSVSMWYRTLSDGVPSDIHTILQDYHDSAMATM
mgnify:FL=1|jgi:hypothetical protein